MKKNKSTIGLIISVLLIVSIAFTGNIPGSVGEEIKNLSAKMAGEGGIAGIFAKILASVFAGAFVYAVYTVIKFILTSIGRKSNRAATVTKLFSALAKYIIGIIGIIWILGIFGLDIKSSLAGVGILGLIIGFGAQSLIEDVITGAFVILEGQYNIGDIIILDEFRGTVREIGVRTTTIEDAGGNLKIVNNSDIRNFQNRSRNTSKAACVVGVSYSTDLDYLTKCLNDAFPEIYGRHSELFLSAPVYLGVEEFAGSSINIKIVADCEETKVFSAQRTLNYEIKKLFDKKGIEIPFPQLVVYKGE